MFLLTTVLTVQRTEAVVVTSINYEQVETDTQFFLIYMKGTVIVVVPQGKRSLEYQLDTLSWTLMEIICIIFFVSFDETVSPTKTIYFNINI